jgi:hypothetical protein
MQQFTLTLTPDQVKELLGANAQQIIESLARIEEKLDTANRGIGQIMTNEEIALAALKKIDDATTSIGTNVTAIGDNVTGIGTVAGTISTEVDALLAAAQKQGVSQALLDQISGIGTKADALSTAATATATATAALVPVLNGIAAKAGNPVPVPIPPPLVPMARVA